MKRFALLLVVLALLALTMHRTSAFMGFKLKQGSAGHHSNSINHHFNMFKHHLNMSKVTKSVGHHMDKMRHHLGMMKAHHSKLKNASPAMAVAATPKVEQAESIADNPDLLVTAESTDDTKNIM